MIARLYTISHDCGRIIRGLHCPWTSGPSEGATLPPLGTSLSPSHTQTWVCVCCPRRLQRWWRTSSTHLRRSYPAVWGVAPTTPSGWWVSPTPAQRPCGWHGRSRGSPGRGPSGANVRVGQSVAGGSDQPVRGVMLTQAPHRYVRRSITPGGVTVRLTHRPPQPNPSTKKKKEPAFSSSFGSGCPHGDALR